MIPINARDLAGSLAAYEAGEMTTEEVIDLFSVLIKSGFAWQLQGHYGRYAQVLIDAGTLTSNGDRL